MVRYIRILELLPEIHCWAPEAVIQNQSHGNNLHECKLKLKV